MLNSIWKGVFFSPFYKSRGKGCRRTWQMKAKVEEILGIHTASQKWSTWILTFIPIIEYTDGYLTLMHISAWALRGTQAQGSQSLKAGIRVEWVVWEMFSEKEKCPLKRVLTILMHSRTMRTVCSERKVWASEKKQSDLPIVRMWLAACWWIHYK